ncbi:MAG TPA: hypothetical protein VGM50_11880 [Gemmatimonadaceae bacterium]|jgi:hypothetical protein
MTRRTEIQLALLVMGLIVWGYGQRSDDGRLTWVGIAFFAAATILRFSKRKPPPDESDDSPDDGPAA